MANELSLSDISGTTTRGRLVLFVRGDVAEARGLEILTDWRDGMVDAAARLEDIDDAPRCDHCERPCTDLVDCEDPSNACEHAWLCPECRGEVDHAAE